MTQEIAPYLRVRFPSPAPMIRRSAVRVADKSIEPSDCPVGWGAVLSLNLRASIFIFISFVEVEKGLDIGAVRESSRPFHVLQFSSLIVAPPSLRQEGIEHENLFLFWSSSVREAPI